MLCCKFWAESNTPNQKTKVHEWKLGCNTQKHTSDSNNKALQYRKKKKKTEKNDYWIEGRFINMSAHAQVSFSFSVLRFLQLLHEKNTKQNSTTLNWAAHLELNLLEKERKARMSVQGSITIIFNLYLIKCHQLNDWWLPNYPYSSL